MPSLSIARLLKTAIRGIGRGGSRSGAGSPTVTGGGRSVWLLLLLLVAGGSPSSPILLSIGPRLIVGHLDLTLISRSFFEANPKALCDGGVKTMVREIKLGFYRTA